MRLDGYHPAAALPLKPSRAPAPATDRVVPPVQPASVPVQTSARVHPTAATGEYISARQGATAPVYGHANQAVASYQAMASLPDADVDGLFGIDVFV